MSFFSVLEVHFKRFFSLAILWLCLFTVFPLGYRFCRQTLSRFRLLGNNCNSEVYCMYCTSQVLWLTDYHPVRVYTDMYVCMYVCICWRHVCVHVCTIQNYMYIAELPVLLRFASVVHFSHDTDLLPTAIQFAWLGYWYHISQKNCLSRHPSQQ